MARWILDLHISRHIVGSLPWSFSVCDMMGMKGWAMSDAFRQRMVFAIFAVIGKANALA
jgi:hypothetical protein